MEKQKNIPILRFPEFKVEWESKSLGELLEFKNGINASKEQYGQGVKFINVLDILNNDFITYNKIIGSVNVDPETVSKYPVTFGDILFQRSSETREEVGSASVYLDKENTATFGGFVIRGRKVGEYDPVFLNKLLKTDIARNDITSKSGGSTRYNVGQEILSNVNLPFPTLSEQSKIATFLTAIDDRLNQLKQKKTLLEQYKKGVMQKIFDQEIRFKDDEGKKFPVWEIKKLVEIGEFKNGINKGKEDFGFGSPFINLMDVFGKSTISNLKLDLVNANEKELKLYELKKGDVLFIRSSVKKSGVGETSLIMNDLKDTVFSGFLIRFRDTKIKLDLGFKKYCFAVRKFRENLISLSTTSANTNINQESLNELEISFPSPAEQTKIANFLSAIDEKISQCDSQITKTEQYKKGLLQQMFV